MAGRRRDLLGGFGAGLGLNLVASLAPGWAARGLAANPSRQPADSKTLSVGALFPVTGPLAVLGDECLRGVQLATDLCNQGGGLFGRQIKLALGDASDPDRAVSEARRLISVEQPVLIMGTGDSALSLCASEVSEGSAIPYWELTATMPSITARGFRYLLRVCDIEPGIAARCIEAAATSLRSHHRDRRPDRNGADHRARRFCELVRGPRVAHLRAKARRRSALRGYGASPGGRAHSA